MNCKDCCQDCQRIGCDIEMKSCTGYVKKTDYCKTCVYYPPSSCDGKPCTQCDPENPLLNCRIEKEAESKPTNADRIRSMTDEELATFLFEYGDCPCVGVKYCERGTRCEDTALMWLKEEAER